MPPYLKPFVPVVLLLIGAAVVIAILKLVLAKRDQGKATLPSFPYVPRLVLSRNEQPLYHWLTKTLSQRYAIFAKVRLADVIDVARGTEAYKSHWNRINAKHVDFLLCDPKSFVPVAAVELQDASHNRADRKDRDVFVRDALAAAEVKLIEVPSLTNFNAADFLAQLQNAAPAKPK
jgi:hypothetical protein